MPIRNPRLLPVLLFALTAPAQEALELTPREFRAGPVTYRAEVGTLRVPEDRGRLDSRTIVLTFARLKSTADEPGAPLFFLAGGPGSPATPGVRSPQWAAFLEIGDVVLLDQRGIGRSKPELVWESDDIRPELIFTDQTTATGHMVELAKKARAHYREQGVDVSAYHTAASVQDIEELRQALGYKSIALLGHSYGTHLGLAFVARHGEHVARFVSVGTAGTGDMMKLPGELDDSVRELAGLVARDERFAEEIPDFRALVAEVIDRAAAEPFAVNVRDPRSGEIVEMKIGRFGMQLILLLDLGDTNDLPVFPRLLWSLDRGDTSMLQWFAQKRYAQFARLPVLTLVNRASSGATEARWRRIEREAEAGLFGTARCFFAPAVVAPFGVRDLGDDFRAPVRSEVPVLFVSGTLDFHTPPHQAERVRAGFPNAGHLIVENGGHEDLLPNPEVQRRVLAFLAGGNASDETVQAPPLRFAPLTGSAPDVRHPSLGR